MIQGAKYIGTLKHTSGIGVVFGALILGVAINPSLGGRLFSTTTSYLYPTRTELE